MFDWLLKTNYVQSLILAYIRHVITAVGAGLIIHGYANQSIVQEFSGFVCSVVSFYLSNMDVKVVDTKIAVALATPPTTSTPKPSQDTQTASQVTSDDPFYNKGGMRK